MKIAVVFAGILRNDLQEIIDNIGAVSSNFSEFEVRSYFVTWPINLQAELRIGQHVDYFHAVDEPDLQWVVENVPNFPGKKKNTKTNLRGGSYVNCYYMFKCRQAAIQYVNDSDFFPDCTLLIRNDAFLNLRASTKFDLRAWLNDGYSVSSCRHSRVRRRNEVSAAAKSFPLPADQLNDHFGLASHDIIDKIYNVDDNEIINVISRSHNPEACIYALVKGVLPAKADIKKFRLSLRSYYLLGGGIKDEHRKRPNGYNHPYRKNDKTQGDN